MAMLELVNVSKQYGELTALAPLDRIFAAHKTYVLLGTSGCGKSTLLKVALALVEVDTGYVRLEGERLTPANVLQMRRRIGYVIQEGGLFPHLTARDNVTLVARQLLAILAQTAAAGKLDVARVASYCSSRVRS